MLRDAYKLAKIVRDNSFCPSLKNDHQMRASQLIDSYSLKTCTFNIFHHIREGKEIPIKLPQARLRSLQDKLEKSDSDDNIEEVMYWAGDIYHMLGVVMKEKKLESIYIPGYNLLGDDKFGQFQQVALSYIKGLREFITWVPDSNHME